MLSAGSRKSEPRRLTHGDGRTVPRLHDVEPAPGRRAREVRRPDDALRGGRYGPISCRRQAWLPSVIASAPAREQLLGEPGRDPDAVGDVLAVDDADVDVEPLAQAGQQRLDRVATRAPDDVADEEDLHGGV